MVRLRVATTEELDNVRQAPLPAGLKEHGRRRTSYREILLDTENGELDRRAISCQLRIMLDGRRTLTLEIGRPDGSNAAAKVERFETEVTETDPTQAVKGHSEPARRLQAVIDPGRLVPRMELEVDRQIRTARSGLLPWPQYEFVFDTITARRDELTATFFEMGIRQLRKSKVTLQELTSGFEASFKLSPALDGPLARATRALTVVETRKEQAPQKEEERELALIAVEDGAVAVCAGSDGLHLPVGPGSGEETCQELMRDKFKTAEGTLVRLGVAPSVAGRPALEVWLAHRLHRGISQQGDPSIQWLPLSQVMGRAGAPTMRDARTLAAFAIASRSPLVAEFAEPAKAPPTRHTPPTDEHTTAEKAQIRKRLNMLSEDNIGVLTSAERFLNPELSWYAFNERVMELAENPSIPLLARVRFLAITAGNLDEFVQVNVARLKRAVAHGVTKPAQDGMTPEEELNALAIRTQSFVDRQYYLYRQLVQRDLPDRGVRVLAWDSLDEVQQDACRTYFEDELSPFLTPKAITMAPGHPFPFIDNLCLSLAVMVRDTEGGPTHLVHVTIPETVPRFIRLEGTNDFVRLESIVRGNIQAIYPGQIVDAVYPFRVTRQGDFELDEEGAADLSQAIAEGVRRRPFAPVVRIESEADTPNEVLERLARELQFEQPGDPSGEVDVFKVDGPVGLGILHEIAGMGLAELDYPEFDPANPFDPEKSVFDIINEGDVLVHHPYDSFDETFSRFIQEAADDPHTVSIKITLYRPGKESALVDSLNRAVAEGKDVTVFIELKARFDEEKNIRWAKQLERAGIHTVTGLVNFKTHAKIALVTRREEGKARQYGHVCTGNYNPRNARMYIDLGLFTAHREMTKELHTLFNALIGSSRPPQAVFRHLLVAPTNMRSRFLELVEREIEHRRSGNEGRIQMVVNALTDTEMINALYRASEAGVRVEAVVRGNCTLRAGVPGLSEHIRVTSVLGRFLEHARIYHFHNTGDDEFYIGSADWRPRNLNRRVEVVAPVYDAAARERLHHILDVMLNDPTGWELQPDGSYVQMPPPTGVDPRGSQEVLLEGTTEMAG